MDLYEKIREIVSMFLAQPSYVNLMASVIVASAFAAMRDKYFHLTVNLKEIWKEKFMRASSPTTFFAEILLPRKDAEAIIDSLETIYQNRFVPRHGLRKAKWLFHAEVVKAAFSTRWEGTRKFLLEWRHKPTRK
jgi:hypothetical protein